MPPEVTAALKLSFRHEELAHYWRWGNIYHQKMSKGTLGRLRAKHLRKAQIHLNRAERYARTA